MNKKNRILLFFSGCVIARLAFIYVAKIVNIKILKLLSIPALLIGISFIYQSIKNKKKGAFGGDAWWSSLRNIHSFLWILFAILAINKVRKAYIVLIIDLTVGIISFINHYFIM
tara:strand:+ start:177 stop:518 length:342 start_codon:yes stop_codon:yes gene_type:complete